MSSPILQIVMMVLLVLIWTVITLTCVPATCSAAPVGRDGTCTVDEHCQLGYYCNRKWCVNCTSNDCGKWKRLPGSSACVKTQAECGQCLPGYTELHEHCTPMDSSEMEDAPTSTNNDAKEEAISKWIYIGPGLVFLFLIIIGSVVTFWVRRCCRCSSGSDGEKMGVRYSVVASQQPEEYTAPPPYYAAAHHHHSEDTDYHDGFQNPAYLETQRQTDVLNRALAYDAGNFPTYIPAQPAGMVPMEEEAEVQVANGGGDEGAAGVPVVLVAQVEDHGDEESGNAVEEEPLQDASDDAEADIPGDSDEGQEVDMEIDLEAEADEQISEDEQLGLEEEERSVHLERFFSLPNLEGLGQEEGAGLGAGRSGDSGNFSSPPTPPQDQAPDFSIYVYGNFSMPVPQPPPVPQVITAIDESAYDLSNTSFDFEVIEGTMAIDMEVPEQDSGLHLGEYDDEEI